MIRRPACNAALKGLILSAARADAIPTGDKGLWMVKKFQLAKDLQTQPPGKYRSEQHRNFLLPAGAYTQLWRYTEATLHLGGELVMQDTPQELSTHLQFMLHAKGRVLITGLGLGCAARGCLANPNVESVTVIERDKDVLELVAPHMPPTDRLKIVHSDALAWARLNRERFDMAWHDLWSDPDKKERALELIHIKVIVALVRNVGHQGAWQMPRWALRKLYSRSWAA